MMRRLPFLLGLTAFLLTSISSPALQAQSAHAPEVPNSPQAHHAAGIQHLQEGQTNEALAEFRQALRLDPNHLPSLLEMADLFSSRGGAFEAYSVLQHASRLEPDAPRVQLLQGRCLFLLKKFPQAREHFHRALTLDPDLTEPHFALAIIENEQGRLAEARQHIEVYLQHAQGDELPQAQQVRVRIALGMKDYDDALAAYRAWQTADPANSSLEMEIARVLLAANRYAEAEKSYRVVLTRNSRNSEALRGLFEASYKRGAYEQAIEAAQQMAKVEPFSCEPLLNLTRAYRMANQVPPARQNAERCLALVPEHPLAHFLLGRLWFSEGDLIRAKSALQKSIQADLNYAEALYWLATVELRLEESAVALPHLEKVVALDPEHAGARYALALQYSRQRRPEEARKQMEEFRRLESREKWKRRAEDDGPAVMAGPTGAGPFDAASSSDWINLGKYLVQENKPRDAIQVLLEARQMTPGDAEALRMLAVAYTEAGEIEQALAQYAEAETITPSGLLYLGRGKIYFRLGETQPAQADLTRAASLELPADKSAEAHLLLASLLNQQKRFADAEAELRRALALEGKNAAARSLLGWTLLLLKRSGDAVAECRQVLKDNPDNASARLVLAQALIDQAQTGEAAKHIRAAAELQGETGLVLLARAKLSKAQGMDKVAISYSAAAGKADPTQVEAFYLLGLLLQDGRPVEAVRAFQQATIVDPEHLQSWLELGKLYVNADQFPAAVESLRKAVILAPDNAEAQYQLAVALSLTPQLSEAEQAARRAKNLGHPSADELLRSLAAQKRR